MVQREHLNLYIDEEVYGRSLDYANYVSDLGSLFYNEDIKPSSSVEKLFVFVIPDKNINKKMYLSVTEYWTQTYYSITPNKIETEDEVIKANINEEINFKGSTIGQSKLKITGYDIKYQFEIPYKLYNLNSVETLSPTFSGNTDKALLKIVGEFSYDKVSSVKNIQELLSRFGYIEYTVGDKTYTLDQDFNEVKSTRAKIANTYYFEVDSSVLKADKIVLGFRLRNADYKYYLKGSA